MPITPLESLLRLAVGVLLGAAIGYERERSGHAAGLRTNMLVALASTLFMLVSTQFVFFQNYEPGGLVMVDTSRIAASVVAGIGFLGAGAIIKVGLGITGLTTAAGLWLVASIGLAAGGGMFLEAAVATAVSLVTLITLRRFEARQRYILRRRIVLQIDTSLTTEQTTLATLTELVANVTTVDLETLPDGKIQIGAIVDLRTEGSAPAVFDQLAAIPGVTSAKVMHPAS
ncbi:MAG: MgtC/SapB family protein [Sorangiineae bacterium]|nr:MgtC/SapB family protein [Polyangiaceae bacterium]MEB2321005.1 MgtC/SapB family protein [Sorangiineae bacterium]